MIRAAVIGHPVSHSLSPLIHRYWFAQQGIEGSYEPVEVMPEDLAGRVRSMADQGYCGFNVTVPHKQAIMKICDRLHESAQAVGAVNTVVIREGVIEGRNTDAFGFVENIKKEAPGFDFRSGPAVVLGAGGAARAAVCGLMREGSPEIVIANRTRGNAEKIARDFGNVKIVDWDAREENCAGAALLVNTSTLGMEGQPPLDIGLSCLPRGSYVCDIVYRPLVTELLHDAQERGLGVITGMGMLLHQARPAFAAWTGKMPVITEELKEMIREKAA